jgi:hypothetical protein
MQDVTFSRRQMLLGTEASLAGLALTGTAVAAPLAQAVASSTATIALECESEPTQDADYVRKDKPRMGV